jgi:surface antigen
LFSNGMVSDMIRRSNRWLIPLALGSSLLLAGCQTTQEQQGQVIGALAGGLLGSQVGGGSGRIAATIAGTVLGGYLGGHVGRRMDESDRRQAGLALDRTPTHQSSSWQNPDTGNRYAVTPTRTFYADEQPCREYTTEASIDGYRETIYGTACRQTDGTWLASN